MPFEFPNRNTNSLPPARQTDANSRRDQSVLSDTNQASAYKQPHNLEALDLKQPPSAQSKVQLRAIGYAQAAKEIVPRILGVEYAKAIEAHESLLQPKDLGALFETIESIPSDSPLSAEFWHNTIDELNATYNQDPDNNLNQAHALLNQGFKVLRRQLIRSFGEVNSAGKKKLPEFLRHKFEPQADFVKYVCEHLPGEGTSVHLMKELLGRTAKLYACLVQLKREPGHEATIAQVSHLFPYLADQSSPYACIPGTIQRLEMAENLLRNELEPSQDFNEQLKLSIHQGIESIKSAAATGPLQSVLAGNHIHIPAMLDYLLGVSPDLLQARDNLFTTPLWSTKTYDALRFINSIKAATRVDQNAQDVSFITLDKIGHLDTLVRDCFVHLHACEINGEIAPAAIENHEFIQFLKTIDPDFNLFEEYGMDDPTFPLIYNEDFTQVEAFDLEPLKSRIINSLGKLFIIAPNTATTDADDSAMTLPPPQIIHSARNILRSSSHYNHELSQLSRLCSLFEDNELTATQTYHLDQTAQDQLELLYFATENFKDTNALVALKLTHDLGKLMKADESQLLDAHQLFDHGLLQLANLQEQLTQNPNNTQSVKRLKAIIRNLNIEKAKEKNHNAFDFFAQVDINNLKESSINANGVKEDVIQILNKHKIIPYFMRLSLKAKLSTFYESTSSLAEVMLDIIKDGLDPSAKNKLQVFIYEKMVDFNEPIHIKDLICPNLGAGLLTVSIIQHDTANFEAMVNFLVEQGFNLTEILNQTLTMNYVQDEVPKFIITNLINTLIPEDNVDKLAILVEQDNTKDVFYNANFNGSSFFDKSVMSADTPLMLKLLLQKFPADSIAALQNLRQEHINLPIASMEKIQDLAFSLVQSNDFTTQGIHYLNELIDHDLLDLNWEFSTPVLVLSNIAIALLFESVQHISKGNFQLVLQVLQDRGFDINILLSEPSIQVLQDENKEAYSINFIHLLTMSDNHTAMALAIDAGLLQESIDQPIQIQGVESQTIIQLAQETQANAIEQLLNQRFNLQ